nr:acylphosphatase [Solirubrobacterales bacterium]
AGWVHNRPDGAVEAHFEGAEPAVRALVDWCGSGPGHAAVDALEVAEADPEGIDGFEVR